MFKLNTNSSTILINLCEKMKPPHEQAKEDSRYLRGTIMEELSNEKALFERETTQLLKFHGIYQQDDRDQRVLRRKQGEAPLYSVMVRSKIPGGRLTAKQYLVHDALSNQYGNGTLRITTRQGLQFHGVLKQNTKAVIRGINRELGTTSGACGDIVRNVMGCPAPSNDRLKVKVYEYAKAVSDQFLARSQSYHEIWLNGEKVSKVEDNEPIYGKTYLPRKFKIALAFPDDNCVDAYTNDIGIVPEIKAGTLAGFNLLVGGGLGMSHGSAETFPRLADLFCFVTPEELLAVTKAIVLVQRDFGDRVSRKHARMKYLIHDRGLDWFRKEVETWYGKKLAPHHPIKWKGYENHLGWHEEGNGKFYFGISIENGRIADMGQVKLKTALREIVSQFQTLVFLMATQDLIISNLKQDDKNLVENILRRNGVQLPSELSNARKHSMACPALPTCGLAITEAERVLPSLIDEFESALEKLGLAQETITIRMTGCPNGCARPYSSEIGLVGRAVGTYNIYLGGSFDGTRLNKLFLEGVPKDDLLKRLTPVFQEFKRKRIASERFGDFCNRVGVEILLKVVG